MKEHNAHSGAWGLALIVTVVASWFLYRYLAPKTWREWASAGVIQAFIIALYAEMYGFPLTIYLLVRFFGLDKTNLNANLWSTLLGYGEAGMMVSMILGYMLLFAGLGIFMEGWRELHRARRETGSSRIVSTGWCATRNTLVFSSHFSARELCIGPRSSQSRYTPSSFSPIICWHEVRSAKWRNNSVTNTAPTGNVCRCSSRAGVNGATWPPQEATTRRGSLRHRFPRALQPARTGTTT